jgi:NADPH:quinone reductase-like Zn-dependent oxidoreductase
MGGPREFAAAMDAFRSGRVRAIVHEVLPLDDLRVAHEHLEAGQQFGKIVLAVDD